MAPVSERTLLGGPPSIPFMFCGQSRIRPVPGSPHPDRFPISVIGDRRGQVGVSHQLKVESDSAMDRYISARPPVVPSEKVGLGRVPKRRVQSYRT